MTSSAQYSIDISIYLYGDLLNPQEISGILGVESDKSHKKGDILIGARTNQRRQTKTGMWALRKSYDSVSTKEFSRLILALISRIVPPKETVLKLPGIEKGHLDLLILGNPDEEDRCNCKLEIAKDVVSEIERLGLPIKIEIGFVDD